MLLCLTGVSIMSCCSPRINKERLGAKVTSLRSYSMLLDPSLRLTLLVIYNGRAAFVFGFLTALAPMIPFILGLLPGLPRNEKLERSSFWSLTCGSAAVLITFTMWRSRTRQGLDRMIFHDFSRVILVSSTYNWT